MRKVSSDEYSTLRSKADSGDLNAAFQLTEVLYEDENNWEETDAGLKPQVDAEIGKWLKHAAKEGHAGAMFGLSRRLAAESLFDEDGNWRWFESDEAYAWLLKAVELGNTKALAMLGSLKSDPDGSRYDPAEGMKLLVSAVLQGNTDSLNDDIPWALQMLKDKFGEVENLGELSIEDLELRAEKDDNKAVMELCKRITVEENVEPTEEQRQNWKNYPESSIEIEGGFFESCTIEIFSALLFAAQKNRAWAQKWLIDFYANPDSPKFNPSEAMAWCAKAASHGKPELVDVPLAGISRALHKQAKAIQEYRESALRGDSEAQFQLGFLYLNGQGLKADKDLAIQWWTRAANNGSEPAKQRLLELEALDDE